MFAKVEKELPQYLIIAVLPWAFKIAADYKGFYPITWAIMIFVTAISMYVIVIIGRAILKFIWSFIRRIPQSRSRR